MKIPETEQALADITDDGLFERLATAILREAEPQYRVLVHSGVNAQGKTVKAPVDGIAFLDPPDELHMLVVHHTITARDQLRSKWLHDPSMVRSRKSRRPTAPQGDVLKTIELVARQRLETPSLRATLVLTTNQEPAVDVVQDVYSIASKAGVRVDLWPRSRLAHFLDNSSSGQWLRREYLHIEVQRLSWELLIELSKKSRDIYAPPDLKDAWIERSLDQELAATTRPVTFVVADSGLGKSIACFKALSHHIAKGGAGIVISAKAISESATLENAIETSLRELYPNLAPATGNEALLLCTSERLMIVVEDINRSGKAAQLAEKLVMWGRVDTQADRSPPAIRLYCPLWPDVLTSMRDDPQKQIADNSVFGTTFSPDEARRAVQSRAKTAGRILSDIDAGTIADGLGRDPLLIALYDSTDRKQSTDVVADYIEAELRALAATQQGYVAAEYRRALHRFSVAVLRRRELNPEWTALIEWGELSELDRQLLSRIVQAGTVLRLSGPSIQQELGYRHDRVRDWLLMDAMLELVKEDVSIEPTLKDPYFAEIIAAVIAHGSIGTDFVERVQFLNPLALFCTLRRLPIGSEKRAHVVKCIQQELQGGMFEGVARAQLRWQAVVALAETDGPEVIRLVNRLGRRSWAAWQARLRNGDVSAAVELCCSVDPGSGAPWRDVQIAHAKLRFGKNLSDKVAEILEKSDLNNDARVGTIRFAGHLACPDLATSLEACWRTDSDRTNHLGDYLWAFAQCCGLEAKRFLTPVCDAWAALPNERAESWQAGSRDALAADHIRWAFSRWVPVGAIPYFIERAKNDDGLYWPILYMLHEIDHPVAITFVVEEAAKIDRRAAEAKSFSHFTVSFGDGWSRRLEHHGTRMSAASRAVLLKLWIDESTEYYLQKMAFRLWSATMIDAELPVLQKSCLPASLADRVLRARLVQNDQSAAPALMEKLEGQENLAYWWQFAKYVMCQTLTDLLDKHLGRLGNEGRGSSDEQDLDYIYSDLLMRLSPNVGGDILARHWNHLQHSRQFVQCALYFATPKLQALAAEAIAKNSSPKSMFKHLMSDFGLHVRGHPGVTRREQVSALKPYFELLDPRELRELWDLCNERGWFDFRRRTLDNELSKERPILYLDDARTFESLDEMVEKDRAHWIDHWLERFGKTGATSSQILSVIGKWLSERKSVGALRLAALAIVHIGRRSDLALLDVGTVGNAAIVEAIRADTRFAVQRRTIC